MNTITLFVRISIIAALVCPAAFANEASVEINGAGTQGVAFKLHGKTSCVLVDDRIFCAPGAVARPTRLASSASQ
jgi:hypothetical protein